MKKNIVKTLAIAACVGVAALMMRRKSGFARGRYRW